MLLRKLALKWEASATVRCDADRATASSVPSSILPNIPSSRLCSAVCLEEVWSPRDRQQCEQADNNTAHDGAATGTLPAKSSQVKSSNAM
mmetsp:Transcript_605/g.1718  ORF Transcript_605/g.1718 Transcript_605/m.1718 type:complete len:90 (-) Transcript_605:29-298(-)